MLRLIFMGKEMILFENSILKMYLLNTHLNFHINSLIISFCLFASYKTICRKYKMYMIKRLIHDLFHIIPAIIPWSISALDCVSGWYGGLGMIPGLIWKRLCINLYISKDCIPKYVVNTNDTLWSVCSIVVDNSGLSGHPNISTMLSQKSVAICHHLSFGEHWNNNNNNTFESVF